MSPKIYKYYPTPLYFLGRPVFHIIVGLCSALLGLKIENVNSQGLKNYTDQP